jgi:hypothetical protein
MNHDAFEDIRRVRGIYVVFEVAVFGCLDVIFGADRDNGVKKG